MTCETVDELRVPCLLFSCHPQHDLYDLRQQLPRVESEFLHVLHLELRRFWTTQGLKKSNELQNTNVTDARNLERSKITCAKNQMTESDELLTRHRRNLTVEAALSAKGITVKHLATSALLLIRSIKPNVSRACKKE